MSQLPRPVSEALREPVTEQSIHRMWRGVAARRASVRARSQRPVWAAAAFAAVAIALVAFWFSARGDSKVGPLRLASGDEVEQVLVGSSGEPRSVPLSDGSRLTLSPGARLTQLENTGQVFSALLDTGHVEVMVQPGGPRQWSFECGLATVEVVGTHFTLERAPERVRVEVFEGIVLVRGERVPNRVRRLVSGDVLEIHASAAEAAASIIEPPPSASVSEPSTESSSDPKAPTAADTPKAPSWRDLARRGAYADAYRSLGERGIAQEAARSDVDDLLALADVARLSGHPAEAVAPLRRVINEHAGDGRAAVAAFTLARIQLDSLGQAGGAAQSFSQALALGLPAPLVEDARARLVEAHSRAGNRDAARAAADEYNKLYPAGRHANAVRRWVSD